MSKRSNRELSYKSFFEMRGAQAFWPTREVSYRLGAAFAFVAHRLSLSPNLVSLMSFVVSLAGVGCGLLLDGWVRTIVILGSLQIGYGLDCADGCLARATHKGSAFGAVFDKTLDAGMMVFLPLMMWFSHESEAASNHVIGIVLAAMIGLRVMLTVFTWIKEEKLHEGNRLRSDGREKGVVWSLKRSIGTMVDEAVYRFLIAVSFGCGVFYEFIVAYCGIVGLVFLGYLVSSHREMLNSESS